jgi:hypothetical protein
MLPIYMILLSIFLISSFALYRSYKKDSKKCEEYFEIHGIYPSYTSVWDTKYYGKYRSED